MTHTLGSSKAILGSYRLLAQLGEGSFSRVFEAEDVRDGSFVALKVFHPGQQQSGFVREAGVGLGERHPNLLHARDVGYLEGGQRYVAYPLARGGTLRDRLGGEALPQPFVRHVAVQIARALEVLHQQGVVHRDLKPDNVLLADDGLFPRVVLGDLGSSWVVRRASALGDVGSPAYMAPEQIEGECDTRADLYSFGVLLYEMLTGERPFDGSINSILDGHLRKDPGVDHLPAEIGGVLRRAMAKDPAERPSAYSLIRLLDEALSQGDSPRTEQIDLSVAGGVFHGDPSANWEAWRDGPVLRTRGPGAPGPFSLSEGRVSAELCASHPAVVALRDSRHLHLGPGWPGLSLPLPLYGLPPLLSLQRFSGHIVSVAGGRRLQALRLNHEGAVLASLSLPFPLCLLTTVPGARGEVILGVDIQRERMLLWDGVSPQGSVLMLPDRVLSVTTLGSTVSLHFYRSPERSFLCQDASPPAWISPDPPSRRGAA
jgi:hypothetical protein